MVIRVETHRLAYMAVPKAACTSIKAALAVLDPDQPKSHADDLGEFEVHGIYPTMRFRPHRWAMYEDHFRFTVVRDPLKRLLAVYTNRVETLGILENCRNIRRGMVHLPKQPDPDYFFQNLPAYILASSDIKHHSLPTWLFTGRDFSLYDRVYRTSDLADLADTLSKRVGMPVDIPHFNSSDRRLQLHDLAPKTQRALEMFLTDQYAHLADFFDNPFDRPRIHAVA